MVVGDRLLLFVAVGAGFVVVGWGTHNKVFCPNGEPVVHLYLHWLGKIE